MKRTLLSLLSILILSTALNAQETYLVANGTETNSYVPVYGYYCDALIRCQTIYPASMLEEINGGQIQSIKYFLSSPSSSQLSSTFQVRIGEVNPASFSSASYLSNTSFQLVYTGTLNTTQSTMTITFTEPYVYGGGNLLIEVVSTVEGNFSSCSFYGVSHTGGSVSGYDYDSWQDASASSRNFIPKTEFTAEVGPQTCPKPTLDDPTVDGLTATINWTENGDARSYAIYLNNNLVEIVNNVTTYTFNNLNPITDYSVKVRAICAVGDTSYAASKTFTTPCVTENLPYNEGFEGFATGSSSFPQCWTNFSNTSNYVQSGYGATGSNAMHIAGPGIVISPVLATNGRPIEVVFSAKVSSESSSGTIQVGFTNNATNLNSVTWSETFQATSNYNTYEVSFPNTGTAQTGYVVFRQNATSSYYYYYIDDVYIGVMSDCRKPENLAVHSVARTGAAIAWEPSDASTPDAYYFEYKTSGSNTWIGEDVREPYKFLTGLTMGTQYDVRVRSICGSDTSRDAHTTFVTPACNVEVGNASTTNNYVPFYYFYNYGYSQSLYPAADLSRMDTIYGIEFNLSTTNTKTWTLDVYIANTSVTSVSTSSFIPATQLTRVVQNRQIVFSQGWNSIPFDTPFVYDGSSNIVVAVDNNTGSYESSLSFYHHSSAGSSSCYWYTDYNDIAPSNPSGSGSNSISTVPDIRFSISCAQEDCQPPLLLPSDIQSHSVTLHWQPMGTGSSWKVEYKQSTVSDWNVAVANTTEHQYTLSNLVAGVTYQFRVTANCTGEDNSAVVSAFTKCDLFDLTYTEDFASGRINPCWTTSTATPNYPTIFSSKLYTGPTAGAWVILPEFVEEIDNLMITFDVNSSSEGGTVKVGATIGRDFSSFEEISSITYTDQISSAEVYFDNYTGNGTNIAIKFESGYTLVDDVVVSLAPSCRRPSNIRVDDVDATTATLSWDAGQNATGATVKYRRSGGRWQTVTCEGNSVTLTGLIANMPYDVIIKANCSGDMSDNSETFTFRTNCADGSTRVTMGYPFIEGFEYGLYCWQQEFVAENLEWVTKAGDGESNIGAHGIEEAYLDDFNALLYNLLVYTAGPKTRIISPMLNTEALEDPWLRYAYGLTKYTDRETNQQYFDELTVFYRTSANGQWVQLKNYTAATTGWVKDSVRLPATSSTFQVSFLGYFKGGNGVALDDVRIYTAGHDTRVDDEPEGIEEAEASWTFRMFPNPANGSTTIRLEGVNGKVHITLMDMSGRTVRTMDKECYGGCEHLIDLQGLAQGAYFVRVNGDRVNSVKKLIVR